MDLLIVRHAIAFERNAKRWPDDDERPLTPEGMLKARKAAKGLKQITERPARLLTSPLVRAQQTAAILTESAGWPKAVECAELSPGKSPEALFTALREQAGKSLAVVGHQPGLGRFLAACVPGAKPEAFEFKKMGVALVSFSEAPRSGGGVLQWFTPPRILRSIG